MEIKKVSKQNRNIVGEITLTGSKSICNRALIIRAFSKKDYPIHRIAAAKDTQTLIELLNNESDVYDAGPAGTTFRFMTAYLAMQDGTQTLTGSERMQQRPIKPLVSVLQELGASIGYLGEEGFPPLKIIGKKLLSKIIEIDGGISSQYISALMLIAPKIEGGLKIKLKGTVVSRSYINLTVSVLKKAGIEVGFVGNEISIKETTKLPETVDIDVEADWSAAAFWYGWVALTPGSAINLLGLNSISAQGDCKLIPYFEGLGVRTKEIENGLRIYKVDMVLPSHLEINLINQPDLAQPLAVVCAILGVEVKLNRLQTLIIKETNRLQAMQTELANFGVVSEITGDSIFIASQKVSPPKRKIKTYNDHRMAMSFALFAARVPLEIEDPDVVSKSYPNYFEHIIQS